MDGVKLVSSAVLGIDCETVIVGGKAYVIFPPTIEKIAGAGMYLSDLQGNSLQEMLSHLENIPQSCKALSWFIQGDDKLVPELCKGTVKEVTDALCVAISMIGIENFPLLSGLARNVRSLIATLR